MTARAGIVVRLLAKQPVPIDVECGVCERNRGYEEHLGADKHWRCLHEKFIPDGQSCDAVRHRIWQSWRIRDGWLRINEMDGTIEMSKGIQEPVGATAQLPPPSYAPSEAASVISCADRSGESRRAWSHPSSSPSPYRPAEVPGSDAVEPTMCTWLWQQHFRSKAWELERKIGEEMHQAGPNWQWSCGPCKRLLTNGQIAAHLLSQEHMREVGKAAGFGSAASSQGLPQSLVQQYCDLTRGRFLLDHLAMTFEQQLPPPTSIPPAPAPPPAGDVPPQSARSGRSSWSMHANPGKQAELWT